MQEILLELLAKIKRLQSGLKSQQKLILKKSFELYDLRDEVERLREENARLKTQQNPVYSDEKDFEGWEYKE